MKPIKSGTLTYQECARCRKLMFVMDGGELCRACERLGALEQVAEAARAVHEWVPGEALGSDRPGPDWASLRQALDALYAAPSEPREAPER